MIEMNAKDVNQYLLWLAGYAFRCRLLQTRELRASMEGAADAMADYEKLKPFLL